MGGFDGPENFIKVKLMVYKTYVYGPRLIIGMKLSIDCFVSEQSERGRTGCLQEVKIVSCGSLQETEETNTAPRKSVK